MANIYEVANAFLAKESMPPQKLQRLSYYFVAWGWALHHKNVVEDAEFEAWVYGPAAEMLYEKYKNYGWNCIPATASCTLTPAEQDLLDSVWLTYGHLSAQELNALTHSEQPWIQARRGLQPLERTHKKISHAAMEEYYASIYAGDTH